MDTEMRNAALEEAALICDKHASMADEGVRRGHARVAKSDFEAAKVEAEILAKAIRALKR